MVDDDNPAAADRAKQKGEQQAAAAKRRVVEMTTVSTHLRKCIAVRPRCLLAEPYSARVAVARLSQEISHVLATRPGPA